MNRDNTHSHTKTQINIKLSAKNENDEALSFSSQTDLICEANITEQKNPDRMVITYHKLPSK